MKSDQYWSLGKFTSWPEKTTFTSRGSSSTACLKKIYIFSPPVCVMCLNDFIRLMQIILGFFYLAVPQHSWASPIQHWCDDHFHFQLFDNWSFSLTIDFGTVLCCVLCISGYNTFGFLNYWSFTRTLRIGCDLIYRWFWDLSERTQIRENCVFWNQVL